jgi:hypothetical protein
MATEGRAELSPCSRILRQTTQKEEKKKRKKEKKGKVELSPATGERQSHAKIISAPCARFPPAARFVFSEGPPQMFVHQGQAGEVTSGLAGNNSR